jgi:hypothetical protein
MLLVNLFEAGIRTADVDLAARKIITDTVRAFAKDLLKRAQAALPSSDDPDDEANYGSGLYDRIWDHFHPHGAQGLDIISKELAAKLSTALTNFVVKRTVDLVQQIPALKKHIDMDGPNRYEFYARKYKFVIEPREHTDDENVKTSLGYVSGSGDLIKVFVNAHEFEQAAWAVIQEEVLGEQMDDGIGALLKVVIPTFVHEYAHHEQNLRRTGWKSSGKGAELNGYSADFGYITVGRKGNNRVPKRGGVLRTAHASPEHNLRYTGNVNEIDSFASGAAAELMHEFLADRARNSWRASDINADIEQIKQDLAQGYVSSDQFSRYTDLVYNTFNGYYDRLGLKREQVQKVWKRFARLVASKLDDYREPTVGAQLTDRMPLNGNPYGTHRATPKSASSKIDQRFSTIAREETFPNVVNRLARIAARDYVNNEVTWTDPLDYYKHHRYASMKGEAWDFIVRHYLGGDRFEEKSEQVEKIFDRLFQRYLEKFAAEKKDMDDSKAA